MLPADEEKEFVELVELVAEARPGGRIAWSMSRFEMGCERALDTEALSDYLLALESLLEAADETGRASLTLRLAALCAEEAERKPVQRRLELAFALERWVMGGGGANAYLEALGPDTPRSLVLELEQHVRALLRDVLCGYLSPDLKAVADDLLLASSEPIEIRARDLREGSDGVAGRRSQAAGAEPEPFVEDEEPTLFEPPPPPPPPPPPEEPFLPPAACDLRPDDELPAGVTPSADWDDDPASYSAPI
jgi:hypothetical protein